MKARPASPELVAALLSSLDFLRSASARLSVKGDAIPTMKELREALDHAFIAGLRLHEELEADRTALASTAAPAARLSA